MTEEIVFQTQIVLVKMRNTYLYLIIFVLAVVVLYLLRKKLVDGSGGGFFEGNSHEEGGIPGVIKANGKKFEFEGGEAILDTNSMAITDRYFCYGMPRQIASELNVLGGSGVSFASGGKCYKIMK